MAQILQKIYLGIVENKNNITYCSIVKSVAFVLSVGEKRTHHHYGWRNKHSICNGMTNIRNPILK